MAVEHSSPKYSRQDSKQAENKTADENKANIREYKKRIGLCLSFIPIQSNISFSRSLAYCPRRIFRDSLARSHNTNNVQTRPPASLHRIRFVFVHFSLIIWVNASIMLHSLMRIIKYTNCVCCERDILV